MTVIDGDLYARPMASALIGRRAELAWLRARVDLALGGFPHLVFVEGEAGIGKTRLAQEALEHARRRRAAVLRGRCYDNLDLPYLPLRDSLFVAMADALGAHGRDADLAVVERARADATLDGAAAPDAIQRERTRELLALTDLVIDHVRTTPTVLFVDDIDWADAATVDLLRHLLFRLDDEQVPLLVLATTRADPSTRAADGIARLRSEPRTAVVHLNPLTPLEATELAREREPGAPIDRARDLASASGGNPLLVEALARDRRARPSLLGGATPTHPIVAAVSATLDALSPPALQVVISVAVLGPDAHRRRVVALSGTNAVAVDEAIDAGVLVDDGTVLAFSHPIYAHTVYDRASTTTRQDLTAKPPRSCASHARSRTISSRATRSPTATPSTRCAPPATTRSPAASGTKAARYYEAAINVPQPKEEQAELHRRAGLSRRGNLQLAQAVGHFESALELVGDDADAEIRIDLHLWRVRCAIGTHDMLDTVRDRGPLEALVDEVEADTPELAAEALVELSQSYWVEWRMHQATRCAERAMAIAEIHDDHSAYARATTALAVPQWARYDLAGSLVTLEEGVAHARAGDDSLLAGGPVFRAPLVLAWMGRFSEAETRAVECIDIADRTQYPLELGLPLAALTQLAIVRGEYDQAEQYAHRALLLQRLSGYHWASGLFLPPLACAYVARGQFDQARATLATWSETADALEQASVDLYSRWVTACERRLTVLGAPLPGLPVHPMIGADAWAVLAVELAQREGATGDLRAAHDLLEEIEALGGVLIGGTASLAARHLGVAKDMLGDEAGAIETLERAAALAQTLEAVPELARIRTELAVIKLRRGEQREAFALLDAAVRTFRELDLESDAARAAQLSGIAPERAVEPIAPNQTSIILFTDVVDSTRLTEELGASHYRARARLAERAVTGAITANGGTIVTGHQPRRRVHRPVPVGRAGRRRGAPLHRRRAAHRPAPPHRGAPGRAHRRRRPHLRAGGEHRGTRVRIQRSRRDPRLEHHPGGVSTRARRPRRRAPRRPR